MSCHLVISNNQDGINTSEKVWSFQPMCLCPKSRNIRLWAPRILVATCSPVLVWRSLCCFRFLYSSCLQLLPLAAVREPATEYVQSIFQRRWWWISCYVSVSTFFTMHTAPVHKDRTVTPATIWLGFVRDSPGGVAVPRGFMRGVSPETREGKSERAGVL